MRVRPVKSCVPSANSEPATTNIPVTDQRTTKIPAAREAPTRKIPAMPPPPWRKEP
jgi:hypothetical protein